MLLIARVGEDLPETLTARRPAAVLRRAGALAADASALRGYDTLGGLAPGHRKLAPPHIVRVRVADRPQSHRGLSIARGVLCQTGRVTSLLPEQSGSSVLPRHLLNNVTTALLDTRVVGVVGPRQAGKSTLVRQIVAERPEATYASLDDADVRALATADPQGFVEGRPGLFVIDEIQRAPDLLLAIKSSVDRQPRAGRFLITGSSQLSANRAVSETLAGRIERHTLWPLSQGEIERRPETFLSRLLDADLATDWISKLDKQSYLERSLAGGYPEARGRQGRRRRAGFNAYVQTVIEREAPGISASPRTADLPRLLRLIAARHAAVLNVSDLAADAQLPRTSVLRYLDTLEALFLIVRIPAWSVNLSQREIRAPKVYLTDSGLAGHLRRAEVAALLRPELARGTDGPIIEGFVLTELLRQASSAPDPPELAHYRDRDAEEIDIIIEGPDGRVAAIEVKAGPGATPAAVRNLISLRDRLGTRFIAGVVLHSGPKGAQLGDRIISLPISALWA
ncbi:MAG: ATP-binding protein [Pseudonocardiaceae bacterium]